ncbi:MAG TPA: diguanylate cyclase domain-containing protein [Elainellaceae cyanobacterium]|jgi:diguanylate cyclase (GGDEF)-like protein
MESRWKQIYPSIKAAVATAESVNILFQDVLSAIAAVYRADGILWAGLNTSELGSLRVFATDGAWQIFDETDLTSEGDPSQNSERSPENSSGVSISSMASPAVRTFRPHTLPSWLSLHNVMPSLVQRETGELIISAATPGKFSAASIAGEKSEHAYPSFLLQLKRSPHPDNSSSNQPQTNLEKQPDDEWSADEIDALQIICGQLELAYNALLWKQQLQQVHQQTALVGRIAHLINSSLNPDEIVGQILAELGQSLSCDRCMVVDLRNRSASLLASWDHADAHLAPIDDQYVVPAIWQDVIEMFLQGGTSYLDLRQFDEESSLSPWFSQMGAVSALVFPLFVLEEFFGAIVLLFTQSEQTRGVLELQIVRQVSDQLAIALMNAQHYQNPWYKQETLRLQSNSLQLEIIRDELTHLLNRHSLDHELDQLSIQAVWSIQPPFSILFCDIDYFKLINDIHGHLIGDEVLKHLAQELQQHLRRDTTLYRYGGEEFVAVLAETSLTAATEVAERLRRAIRATPIQTTVDALDITVSFGIAQQNPDIDRHAKDVLHRAEQALLKAKYQGRDRVEAL